jgi:hypothetical protein
LFYRWQWEEQRFSQQQQQQQVSAVRKDVRTTALNMVLTGRNEQ